MVTIFGCITVFKINIIFSYSIPKDFEDLENSRKTDIKQHWTALTFIATNSGLERHEVE